LTAAFGHALTREKLQLLEDIKLALNGVYRLLGVSRQSLL
jgi:hypothetical protein